MGVVGGGPTNLTNIEKIPTREFSGLWVPNPYYFAYDALPQEWVSIIERCDVTPYQQKRTKKLMWPADSHVSSKDGFAPHKRSSNIIDKRCNNNVRSPEKFNKRFSMQPHMSKNNTPEISQIYNKPHEKKSKLNNSVIFINFQILKIKNNTEIVSNGKNVSASGCDHDFGQDSTFDEDKFLDDELRFYDSKLYSKIY